MNNHIVDAHLHVWEMPSERFPWSRLRNMQPAQAATVETLLETMEQHGVSKAIIVQPSNYGYDHRYVLDCMARYPGRFGAVALFDFRAPNAVEHLVDLAAQGLRSIRLYLYHDPDVSWYESEACAPVLRKASELGMIVCVFGKCDMLECVHTLARRYPGLRFVLDHLGHPDVQKPETWSLVMRFGDLPNVCIKVSDFPTLSRQPYPFADVHPFVREVYDAFGARRMIWASNFPHIVRQVGYGHAVRLVDSALPGLPATDRARIMGGTAAELWDL